MDFEPLTDLWIHPKTQRLPLTLTYTMLPLKDGALLAVDGADACCSRDEGVTWERRPIFHGATANHKASFEYGLIRSASGALVLVYMDKSNEHWSWDNEKREPSPDARSEVWSTRSLDEGRTWSDPIRLFGGYCGAIIKMIQTRSGRIVVPVQPLLYNPGRHGQMTYYSDDDGLTWTPSNLIDLGGRGHHDGCFEGCMEELMDGRLWMLIRTNLDRFWQAFSDDQGASWRTIMPTTIDASSAPAYILRLQSGRLVMAWNRLYPEGLTPAQQAAYPRKGRDTGHCDHPACFHRSQVSIAFSGDDGAAWTAPVIVMRRPERGISYPFILERQPGLLWLTTRFNGYAAIGLREADFVGS